MVELNQLKQAKEIIAYLKNENKESAQTKLGNHLLKSPINTCDQYVSALNISQKSCDNFQLSVRDKSASDKNNEIRNIIKNLKARKEQKFKDITFIDKTVNNTNLPTKKGYENGDINKSMNYSPNPNKRFKSNHINSSKQFNLTEFYNVVKSTGNHDDKYKCDSCISKCVSNIKCKNHIQKGLSFQNPTVLNSNTNIDFNKDKTVFHTSIEKENKSVTSLQRDDSKSRKKRAWDLFHNIKKTNESQLLSASDTNTEKKAAHKLKQVNRADIQKNNYPNKTAFENTCNRTVDDFCNKIMTFTKSFSTGNIISEKESHKDTDSIPLTRCEMGKVEKRLEGNTTFDDFIEKVLKKIHNENNENTTSIIDLAEVDYSHKQENYLKVGTEKNASNKFEKYNEEMIVPIAKLYKCGDENKSQISLNEEKFKNSELVSAVTIIHENMNLCAETNFSEFNQNSDRHKNCKRYFEDTSQDIDLYCSLFTQKYVDSKKHESASQTNRLGLILEKENHIMEDKHMTVEKECNVEDFYNCVDTICSQNEINSENSLEAKINLLDNDLEKSILTAAYKQKKVTEKREENVDSFKLDNFLENIVPSIEKKEYKKNMPHKYKFQVKRYRKGKTKIYKLKKLKKRFLQTKDDDEDLTFHDLLKKITTDGASQPRLSRFKSGSSISTSSSYVPDDTKSDVLSTGSIELTSPQQRLRKGFNELSKDKSLCYSGNEWEDIPEHDKEEIKIKIQDIFFQILEDFKNKRYSYFRHRRQSFDNCIFKDGRLQFKPRTESFMTVISSGAQRSKAKFQLMLYILKKIQTLLETDTKLTKRELYYQLKVLISDQRICDRAINAISCLLDVGMWALNIIAQKGLVFGDLKLLLSSGEMLNCNIPGTLIPQNINDIVEVHSTAYFILVVEKESIFHKLIEEDLPNKLTRPFIMITGKGFPDLNTQLFLRKLWMVMSIPVFILVDADPHGINIMLNYRFGSVNNAHVSRHLAVPKAKWLGVYPSEIINLNIARQPLNEREIRLVNHMLRTPYMEFSPKLINELRVLLTKKFKAGIEGLMKTDTYLSEVYLPNKFFTHNFI